MRSMAILVGLACVAAIGPSLALGPSGPSVPIAEADTDVQRPAVNVTERKHIARNIIVGNDPIEVCTGDYPNALAHAIVVWNSGLQGHSPQFVAAGTNVFVASCADTDDDWIDSVQVDARHPSADDFMCGGSARDGLNRERNGAVHAD